MKQIVVLLFVIAQFMFSCTRNNNLVLHSPDSNLEVQVLIENGKVSYQVLHAETKDTIIENSKLGLARNDQAFVDDLEFVSVSSPVAKTENYEMISGKKLLNSVDYNEFTVQLKNSANTIINIDFRAYNEGIAFRYNFSGDDTSKYTILKETTTFNIPEEGHAWIQPYDTLGIWSPAYEYGYEKIGTIGETAPLSTGWGFPALFHSKENWILITESGLDTTYCASHLHAECSNGEYAIEFPASWENYGMWKSEPQITIPFQSPWRVIIIGDNAGTIVESNMVLHLAKEREIQHTEWVKPGISSWNWWSDHNGGRKFESLKHFVDFSASMGWPYSLVDANWQDMDKGSLEELVAYANSKNVDLFIWYNSAGPHSQVMDAGPRDLMHNRQVRREEMKRIRDLGIKGIKVDFFQGEKQGIIKLYLDLIRDAADHQLMVVTHGCTIPRGWMRTYPNIISMEAVRGGELYSNPQYPMQAVYQNTILPFSRNVIGSMDFTPVTFSDFNSSCKHMTSNAHELALSVIFESGIQHFSDRVESYMSMPEKVIEYLKNVPTVWDDTKFIEGYPGEYIVMARKRNNTWYVAGINGSMQERNIELDLSDFYQNTQGNTILFTDGEFSRDINVDTIHVNDSSTISITLEAAGGFCMYSVE